MGGKLNRLVPGSNSAAFLIQCIITGQTAPRMEAGQSFQTHHKSKRSLQLPDLTTFLCIKGAGTNANKESYLKRYCHQVQMLEVWSQRVCARSLLLCAQHSQNAVSGMHRNVSLTQNKPAQKTDLTPLSSS